MKEEEGEEGGGKRTKRDEGGGRGRKGRNCDCEKEGEIGGKKGGIGRTGKSGRALPIPLAHFVHLSSPLSSPRFFPPFLPHFFPAFFTPFFRPLFPP
jgi:hypothetical protein